MHRSSHQWNRSGMTGYSWKSWPEHLVCAILHTLFLSPKMNTNVRPQGRTLGNSVFTIQKRSRLWKSREIRWNEPEALNDCMEPSSLSMCPGSFCQRETNFLDLNPCDVCYVGPVCYNSWVFYPSVTTPWEKWLSWKSVILLNQLMIKWQPQSESQLRSQDGH